MNTTVYVHTLGDSTLDNYYWMLTRNQTKDCSVEGQLQEKLDNNLDSHQYKVISHAYDGFTTSSVLNGDHVGRVLNIRSNMLNSDKTAYLNDRGLDSSSDQYFVHPLNNFKEFIEEHPQTPHYVVISVGGNDFRERLFNPIAMLKEIPRVHERYLQILSEIKSLKDRDIRPILMFQYRLDVHHDHYLIYTILKVVGVFFAFVHSLSMLGISASVMGSVAKKIHYRWGIALFFLSSAILAVSHRVIPLKVTKSFFMGKQLGLATLGGLMENFYRPILAQAKSDKIPILDLPNTFNPHDSDLYIAQIEPSQKGSQLIAEGINFIIKNDDRSKSMIYSKSDDREFIGSENPGFFGWSVADPKVERSADREKFIGSIQ